MPGPISDSYDPEWGTNCHALHDELIKMYELVSRVLGNQPPVYVLNLLPETVFPEPITATLTEREWRLLRFALERAIQAL